MLRHLTVVGLVIGLSAGIAIAPAQAGTDTPDTLTQSPPSASDGLLNSLREHQHGVAPPVYNDDLTTGTVTPNRWRGLQRPTNEDQGQLGVSGL